MSQEACGRGVSEGAQQSGDDAQHSRRGHRGKKSGGDALMGNTRSHPEHEG